MTSCVSLVVLMCGHISYLTFNKKQSYFLKINIGE